jgi:hypothetical protein
MLQNIPKSVLTASLLLWGEVTSTQTCLSCLRQDTTSGFLGTYSYCARTDTCVQNVWNYIDNPCPTEWVRGRDLNLVNDCKANQTTCQDFTSTPEKASQYFNRTWTLPEMSYCVITVDANEEIARVIFDNTSFLGVMEAGY